MRFIAPRESLGSCFSYALTLRTSVPSQGNAWRSILSGTVGGCEVCIFASFPTFTTELFLVWYAKCYSWKLSIDKIYRSGQHQRKIDTSLNRPLKGENIDDRYNGQIYNARHVSYVPTWICFRPIKI